MGSEICPKCGLPKDICCCDSLAIEEQRIKIFIERRKWGKAMTIIEGLNSKDVDLDKLATQLKNYCACGGTSKEGRVELQGDQRDKAQTFLLNQGYRQDFIDIR